MDAKEVVKAFNKVQELSKRYGIPILELELLLDEAFDNGWTGARTEAHEQRDAARFQIERAIAQLETMDGMKAREASIVIESVLTQLEAFVKSEGGPWYQRG